MAAAGHRHRTELGDLQWSNLRDIVKFLPGKDFVAFGKTCRKAQRAVRDAGLWRDLIKSDFSVPDERLTEQHVKDVARSVPRRVRAILDRSADFRGRRAPAEDPYTLVTSTAAAAATAAAATTGIVVAPAAEPELTAAELNQFCQLYYRTWYATLYRMRRRLLHRRSPAENALEAARPIVPHQRHLDAWESCSSLCGCWVMLERAIAVLLVPLTGLSAVIITARKLDNKADGSIDWMEPFLPLLVASACFLGIPALGVLLACCDEFRWFGLAHAGCVWPALSASGGPLTTIGAFIWDSIICWRQSRACMPCGGRNCANRGVHWFGVNANNADNAGNGNAAANAGDGDGANGDEPALPEEPATEAVTTDKDPRRFRERLAYSMQLDGTRGRNPARRSTNSIGGGKSGSGVSRGPVSRRESQRSASASDSSDWPKALPPAPLLDPVDWVCNIVFVACFVGLFAWPWLLAHQVVEWRVGPNNGLLPTEPDRDETLPMSWTTVLAPAYLSAMFAPFAMYWVLRKHREDMAGPVAGALSIFWGPGLSVTLLVGARFLDGALGDSFHKAMIPFYIWVGGLSALMLLGGVAAGDGEDCGDRLQMFIGSGVWAAVFFFAPYNPLAKGYADTVVQYEWVNGTNGTDPHWEVERLGDNGQSWTDAFGVAIFLMVFMVLMACGGGTAFYIDAGLFLTQSTFAAARRPRVGAEVGGFETAMGLVRGAVTAERFRQVTEAVGAMHFPIGVHAMTAQELHDVVAQARGRDELSLARASVDDAVPLVVVRPEAVAAPALAAEGGGGGASTGLLRTVGRLLARAASVRRAGAD